MCTLVHGYISVKIKIMGLFSRKKYPIHGVEYSIGSDGLTNHYYCKKCRKKAMDERNEKLEKDREIADLKRRLETLEKKDNGK